MKAPHIMRRGVSYLSNEETGGGAIQKELHESLLEKTNFWQNVLERLVNVTLILAKCNLPFRGSSAELSKNNKSNFVSIIQLLAKYDTVLDKVLQLSKVSPKYLSSLLQNNFISVLAEEVLRDIKIELQSAPFLLLFLIPLKISAKNISK